MKYRKISKITTTKNNNHGPFMAVAKGCPIFLQFECIRFFNFRCCSQSSLLIEVTNFDIGGQLTGLTLPIHSYNPDTSLGQRSSLQICKFLALYQKLSYFCSFVYCLFSMPGNWDSIASLLFCRHWCSSCAVSIAAFLL